MRHDPVWVSHCVATVAEWGLVVAALVTQLGSPLNWVALGTRLHQAIYLPTGIELWAAITLGVSLFVLVSVGLLTGFLSLPTWPPAPGALVGLLTTLLCPAVMEEFWFRALLVPADGGFAHAILPLAAFMLYHVDLIHNHDVFRDWRFLSLAAAIGVGCTAAFLGTQSIWPPILFHWISVWIWIFFCGGKQLFEKKNDDV